MNLSRKDFQDTTDTSSERHLERGCDHEPLSRDLRVPFFPHLLGTIRHPKNRLCARLAKPVFKGEASLRRGIAFGQLTVPFFCKMNGNTWRGRGRMFLLESGRPRETVKAYLP